VPAGDLGFWQGAFRDHADPGFGAAAEAIRAEKAILSISYTAITRAASARSAASVCWHTPTATGSPRCPDTGTWTGPTPADRKPTDRLGVGSGSPPRPMWSEQVIRERRAEPASENRSYSGVAETINPIFRYAGMPGLLPAIVRERA